jgi:hypothetical protein
MLPKHERSVSGEWECMECGYIEQGVESRRPSQCHDCGASARALEFFPGEAWEEGADDDDDFDAEEYEARAT